MAVTKAAVSRGWRSMARVARRNTSTARSAALAPLAGTWLTRRSRARAHSTWAAERRWSLDVK